MKTENLNRYLGYSYFRTATCVCQTGKSYANFVQVRGVRFIYRFIIHVFGAVLLSRLYFSQPQTQQATEKTVAILSNPFHHEISGSFSRC